MKDHFLQEDDTAIMKKIGARVRKKRRAAGLTQEKLAEHMDCSITTISRLENGQQLMSLVNLIRLAHLLNTNVSDFFVDFNFANDITLKTDDSHFLDLLKEYSPSQREYLYQYMAWLLEKFPDFLP